MQISRTGSTVAAKFDAVREEQVARNRTCLSCCCSTITKVIPTRSRKRRSFAITAVAQMIFQLIDHSQNQNQRGSFARLQAAKQVAEYKSHITD
jgi:hypothetical protein